MKQTILISGAASGLGHAFLKALIADPETTIIAIDRQKITIPPFDTPPTTTSTSTSTPTPPTKRLQTHQLDITNEASINTLTNCILTIPITTLIHSVGIRGLVPALETKYPNDIARAEQQQVMTAETMMQTYQTNTIATFTLIRALLPNLRLGSTCERPAKVIVMGSRMGSVSCNVAGGAYAYRASKAALNAVVKSFSVDVPELVFAVLHPGRVETALVRCREEGAIEAEESVTDLLKLIGRLGRRESGGFYDRFGETIGW